MIWIRWKRLILFQIVNLSITLSKSALNAARNRNEKKKIDFQMFDCMESERKLFYFTAGYMLIINFILNDAKIKSTNTSIQNVFVHQRAAHLKIKICEEIPVHINSSQMRIAFWQVQPTLNWGDVKRFCVCVCLLLW